MKQNVIIKVLAYFLLSLPVFTIITSMSIAMNATTTKPTFSADVDSRITLLQSEISNFNDEANRWNGRYVRSLTAALFIGLWTLVCQYSAIQKSRLVSDRQSELLHLKDIKAEAESKDKDERIAKVKADADVQIAEVEADADDKIFRAKTLAEQIGIDANRKSAKLREQNLATEAKLLSAQQDLEKEKLTRIEMEKTLLPRVFVHRPSNILLFDRLKQFAGTKVSFETINDAEAQRAASRLVGVLRGAGWEIGDLSINPELNAGHFDGVRIECSIPEGKDAFWTVPSFKAISAVSELLKEQGWTAVYTDQTAKGIEAGNVRIRVGFKPNLYFLEKLVQ